jgi:hypothetical protein
MIVREGQEVVKVDGKSMERAMGFEPTTFCLGSKHSTTELRPPSCQIIALFSYEFGRLLSCCTSLNPLKMRVSRFL